MYCRFKFEDNELDGPYYKLISIDPTETVCEIFDSSDDYGEFTTMVNLINIYHIKKRSELTDTEKIIGIMHYPLILGYKLTRKYFPKIASKFRHFYIKQEIKYLGRIK